MKLRTGHICAAYVPLQEGPSWIIARIEKSLPNGDYVVRDEAPDDQQNGQYTVKRNQVTHFPAINSCYVPGEKVLALWCDPESKQWSTMFYTATVVEVDGPQKITISFSEPPLVETDESKLAKFPSENDIETEEGDISDGHNENLSTTNTNRRIFFTAGAVKESPPIVREVTDEQLTELMGPEEKVRRLKSIEGTPLIDMLNEPSLFPQISPHVTVNGSLTLTNMLDDGEVPEIMKRPDVHVGRLSRIMHEWRK